MKIEACNFSGFKIYPGHGSLFIRSDARVFRFLSAKNKSLFLQRKKPSKFDWTIVYRRIHKKGNDVESGKKRVKKTAKVQRAVVGASLEAIKAKRDMNPALRVLERKKAVDKIKEDKKAKVAKKDALRASQPKQKQNTSKQSAKGFSAKPAATSR